MSKIAEPEIVFCEHNHIYDKSLSASCPYCKQIAERTDQIKSQIDVPAKRGGNKFWSFGRQGRDVDNNVTMLLSRKFGFYGRNQSDDDDATVLASSMQDEDDATVLAQQRQYADEDYDDATVLSVRHETAAADNATALHSKATEAETKMDAVNPAGSDPANETVRICQTDAAPMPQTIPIVRETVIASAEETPAVTRPVSPEHRRKVIGWLVCTVSEWDCGTSLELKEGDNFIGFDADGRLLCLAEENASHEAEAVIYRDRITGIFQIRTIGDFTVTINEQELAGCTYMQPYSRIQFSKASVVFFPAVGVCGFEWRQ